MVEITRGPTCTISCFGSLVGGPGARADRGASASGVPARLPSFKTPAGSGRPREEQPAHNWPRSVIVDNLCLRRMFTLWIRLANCSTIPRLNWPVRVSQGLLPRLWRFLNYQRHGTEGRYLLVSSSDTIHNSAGLLMEEGAGKVKTNFSENGPCSVWVWNCIERSLHFFVQFPSTSLFHFHLRLGLSNATVSTTICITFILA